MSTDSPIPFAVLNPGGRDPFIDYAHGTRRFEPGVHPPVNYHAFAAATGGRFCDSVDQVLQGPRVSACIVLLRRKMSAAAAAVKKLKAAGVPVFLSWKECGSQQICQQLASPKSWAIYRSILQDGDGIISPGAAPPPIPADCDIPLFEIATPYPLDLPDWASFAVPMSERRGIFVGTREFFSPARNHLSAVATAVRAARKHGTFVTVINCDKQKGRKLLEAVCEDDTLQVCEGPLPYDAYLRTLASHRLVFHMDRGEVPGQVAGDALLCRSICLGGNTRIEAIAFPYRGPADLDLILADDSALAEAIEKSQEIGGTELSFLAGGRKLREVLGRLEE